MILDKDFWKRITIILCFVLVLGFSFKYVYLLYGESGVIKYAINCIIGVFSLCVILIILSLIIFTLEFLYADKQLRVKLDTEKDFIIKYFTNYKCDLDLLNQKISVREELLTKKGYEEAKEIHDRLTNLKGDISIPSTDRKIALDILNWKKGDTHHYVITIFFLKYLYNPLMWFFNVEK